MARNKKSAGKRRVTLNDIAQQAGVSVMAVSHVLNGAAQGRISVGEEKTERIREAAKRLNYIPNYAAKQLIQGDSGFIGVMVAHDGIQANVHSDLLRHLIRAIAKTQYHPLPDYTYQDVSRIDQAAREFLGRRVDGVIVVVPDFGSKWEGYGDLLDQFDHLVMIGNAPAAFKDLVRVYHDYAAGIAMSVDHLAERGRSRIAIAPLPPGVYSMDKRFEGYKAGLKRAGLTFDKRLVIAKDPKAMPLEEVVRELVNAGADAIIARNDLDALKIIRILEDLGKEIPADIAVVGHDNSQWTEDTRPALTSVDLRSQELAEVALEMLLAKIKDEPLPERELLLTPHLIVRKSS